MSSQKSKLKSLSEKISESFEPRSLKDPELDSDDETTAKYVETNIGDNEDYEFNSSNNILSDIRKRNAKLLSEYSDKYSGKISSRKDFEENENKIESDIESKDEEKTLENETDSTEDEDLEEYRKILKDYQIDSEPDELGTEEDEINDEKSEDHHSTNGNSNSDQEDSDYDSSVSSGESDDHNHSDNNEEQVGTKFLKEKNQTANIQKGLSVQNQLKVWENLLEVRIRSQKVLMTANSLPSNEKYKKLSEENEDFLKLAKVAQQNVTSLLDKMTELQQLLLNQYPETKSLSKSMIGTKRKLLENDEIPIKRFAEEMNQNFEQFTTYRNSVLQKWHDRTKILNPSSGLKNKSNSDNFDIIKKIEGSLFNKSELIKKSRTVKGNYVIFGQKPIEETEKSDNERSETTICPEIYDDTDFYHQQLRELIEFKTNTLTNPSEVSKQFAELQKLRHKMKKKVDTRASKGRKIRYVIHNKLVNFMAPNDNSTWTEDSKEELYRSLFST